MMEGHEHSAPAVFALETSLYFPAPLREIDLKEIITAFLSDCSAGLQSRGCTLIGHIKGLIASDEKGHLAFGITSFGERPSFKGQIIDEVMKALFAINIIVFGVESTIVDAVFHESFHTQFSRPRGG